MHGTHQNALIVSSTKIVHPRPNIALTLTLQTDHNSKRNPITKVHVLKHRIITLALTMGPDPFHEYRRRTYLTVTLSFNHTVSLTSERSPKCKHNLIQPIHLTEPITLTVRTLAPGTDTSQSTSTTPTAHPTPVTQCRPHPHIRARFSL